MWRPLIPEEMGNHERFDLWEIDPDSMEDGPGADEDDTEDEGTEE